VANKSISTGVSLFINSERDAFFEVVFMIFFLMNTKVEQTSLFNCDENHIGLL